MVGYISKMLKLLRQHSLKQKVMVKQGLARFG